MLDFKTRSAFFPGIINFVQTHHLIFVLGSCAIKRVHFPEGVGEVAAVWSNGFLALKYSENAAFPCRHVMEQRHRVLCC